MTCVVCRYDPLQDRWTGQPKLNRPRFALSAASAHGALYAVGGFNGEFYMSSVEVYDPRVGRYCHHLTPGLTPPVSDPSLSQLLFVSPLFILPLFVSPIILVCPLCLLPISLDKSDTPSSCVCCEIDFALLSMLLESSWILRCLSRIGSTSKMVALLPFTSPHRKAKQRRIFMSSKLPTVSKRLTFCATQC